MPVSVSAASRRDVPIRLTGLGTVQATFTVGIHSQVDGKLQEVFFKEGQRVKKGDVLAKIDPRLFKAALDQAKAKKAQDEAQLVSFQKDLARFQTLGAKGFETQQNLDLQQAKVDTGKASLAADEAAIETAQTQLDYTDIKAPSDGRMGVRMVDPGNVVHASDQGSIGILVQAQPAFGIRYLTAPVSQGVDNAELGRLSEFVGGDCVVTLPASWQRRFNASDVSVRPRMDEPVASRTVDELRRHFPDF